MTFPEGPPTDEPQRYATDGRDAEGTSPTADATESTTAALAADDPSEGSSDSAAGSGSGTAANGADWDDADRNTAGQPDDRGERAPKPGGALGPGTTATGGGTSLD